MTWCDVHLFIYLFISIAKKLYDNDDSDDDNDDDDDDDEYDDRSAQLFKLSSMTPSSSDFKQ